MPTKRYTDIHMEKRYTNGHSLKGYFIRLPQNQIDFLKSLPKGDGSSFIRQAIAEKISSACLNGERGQQNALCTELEAMYRKKVALERELHQVKGAIEFVKDWRFSEIDEYDKNGSLKLKVELVENKVIWDNLSEQEKQEYFAKYPKNKNLIIHPTHQISNYDVKVVYSGKPDITPEDAKFLAELGDLNTYNEDDEDEGVGWFPELLELQGKKESIEDTFYRIFKAWQPKHAMLDLNRRKEELLEQELSELKEAIRGKEQPKSIEIYKDHADIQIYKPQPPPEPQKRGASQVEAST